MGKKYNVSLGRCANRKCVRKIWPGDAAVNVKGKLYHARCAPEEKEAVEDAAKPQMKGTGGWGGGPFRYFKPAKPQRQKRDYSKYYPD